MAGRSKSVAGVKNRSRGSRCVAGVQNGLKLGCRGSKTGGGGCKQVSRARKGVWVGVDTWWWVETHGWGSKTGAGGLNNHKTS